jgi:phosphonopyruvate decarboxylase
MLLLIGWRGEPGRHDEPQHLRQGELTLPLLAAIGVAHDVLPEEETAAAEALRQTLASARARSAPQALVVRAGTFTANAAATAESGFARLPLSRAEAIRIVAGALPASAAIVATTGMASRELYEHRVTEGAEPGRDFLTVGSMGHASQIALGMALARADRIVCCLDGDGAVLMHMGALAIIGSRRPRRFIHVVLNNGAHDSVGGQPTAAREVDLRAVARACGYARTERVKTEAHLRSALAEAMHVLGPVFIEVHVRPGACPGLGRPQTSPRENKEAFMRRLGRE